MLQSRNVSNKATHVQQFYYIYFDRSISHFGTFSQLVSQDLKSVSGKKTELVHSVMRAMDDYIQKPYHIEMLWFMLKSARKQYGV